MYSIFPVLKPFACGRQSRCLGWIYKLPSGLKLVLNFPSFCRNSTEKAFNFIKNAVIYKLPRGAINKPPCVPFINNPSFAIHQVFALSRFAKEEPICWQMFSAKCWRLFAAPLSGSPSLWRVQRFASYNTNGVRVGVRNVAWPEGLVTGATRPKLCAHCMRSLFLCAS